MSAPGWGVHNFELALRRWWRDFSPEPDLVDQLRAWRDQIESEGIIVIEAWALIGDDDEFIGRIPNTQVIVSGELVPYEQLVVVRAFIGA